MDANRCLNQTFKRNSYATDRQTDRTDCLMPLCTCVPQVNGDSLLKFADTHTYACRTLALGIGIQNFPEGLAVSLPLRAAGVGVGKSFW